MKAIGFLIGFTLLALPRAEAASLRCDGCDADRARGVALEAGPGVHHVLDYRRREIWRFSVGPGTGPTDRVAVELPVDARVREGFGHYLEARSLSPLFAATRSTVVVLSPTDADWGFFDPDGWMAGLDAHAVAADRSLRGRLSKQLGDALAFAGDPGGLREEPYRLARLVSSALWKAGELFAGGPNPVGLGVVLRWRDGSMTTYTVGPASVHAPEYASGRSTDSEGRLLPDESALGCPACYAGQWSFTDTASRDGWVELARIYGIRVSPGSMLYTCAWDRAREETHCRGSGR